MAIFGPKPCVIPFGRMSVFRLFDLVVFIAQKGVFSLQNIMKPFSWPILPIKKTSNNGHFCTKFMGQFLDLLNLLFLQPTKAFFRSRITSKTFSWPILPKKKSWKNGQFLDQNHGLIRLEKCQFLDFLDLLFLQARMEFFRSRIS